MALREIVVDGVWWVVFAVPPGRHGETAGWLCAQSLSDKRRIAPLPAEWERWPEDALAASIRAAAPLPPLPLP